MQRYKHRKGEIAITWVQTQHFNLKAINQCQIRWRGKTRTLSYSVCLNAKHAFILNTAQTKEKDLKLHTIIFKKTAF